MAAAAEQDVIHALRSLAAGAAVVVDPWDLPAVKEVPEANLPCSHLGQD